MFCWIYTGDVFNYPAIILPPALLHVSGRLWYIFR